MKIKGSLIAALGLSISIATSSFALEDTSSENSPDAVISPKIFEMAKKMNIGKQPL